MMFSRALKSAAAAAVWGVVQGAWAGPVVYEQTWNDNSFVYGSQNDPTPGGKGAALTVYDDFRLDSAQQVDTVQWFGGFYNPGTAVPIEAFTIQFYADSGGAPGASLYVARQAATSTFLGFRDNVVFGPLPMYAYTMDLALDFLADASTTYWISIVAELPFTGFGQQWGVATSAQGNGGLVQNSNGAILRQRADTAFALTAAGPAAVPEPGSLPLVALAVTGLALLGRRRTTAAGLP